MARFLARANKRSELQSCVEEVMNLLADIADNLATIEGTDDKDEKEAAHEEIETTAADAIGQVVELLRLLKKIAEVGDED